MGRGLQAEIGRKPHHASHSKPEPQETFVNGSSLDFFRPKPQKAEPMTRLSSQAGPGNH